MLYESTIVMAAMEMAGCRSMNHAQDVGNVQKPVW